MFAVIEPGSAFVGILLELALASDRQYMLDGVYEDVDPDATPAAIEVTESNFGDYPMGNGWSCIESRFYGHPEQLAAVSDRGFSATGGGRRQAGPGHSALDDIDFADELRITLEERASLSPDSLTGMEANHRFVGPEIVETKIFGRLTVRTGSSCAPTQGRTGALFAMVPVSAPASTPSGCSDGHVQRRRLPGAPPCAERSGRQDRPTWSRTLTYGELSHDVASLAAGLRGLGLCHWTIASCW